MATRSSGSGGDDSWFDRAEPAEPGELALEQAEERLPWLESDDEGEEEPAYDMGRLVGFGLILLVLLVTLVGGVWFVTNRDGSGGPAPDGSLIQAPDTPYKVRPDDPGGKTFAGTGDTSYAVGAGREVDARLAPAPSSPTIAPETPPAVRPEPAASATPRPTSEPGLPAGTAVQVGAYSNRADAEAGWRRLVGQTDVLAGVSYRIIAGRADIGTVYRLQAVGGDKAGAQALCSRLQESGIACQVK
jgi:hypothetical protein